MRGELNAEALICTANNPIRPHGVLQSPHQFKLYLALSRLCFTFSSDYYMDHHIFDVWPLTNVVSTPKGWQPCLFYFLTWRLHRFYTFLVISTAELFDWLLSIKEQNSHTQSITFHSKSVTFEARRSVHRSYIGVSPQNQLDKQGILLKLNGCIVVMCVYTQDWAAICRFCCMRLIWSSTIKPQKPTMYRLDHCC